MMKKIFKRPQANQWMIIDKETVDEIIFRTTDRRNRLILELMAQGGMRIGGGSKNYVGRYSGRFSDHPKSEKWQARRAGLCSTENPGKIK